MIIEEIIGLKLMVMKPLRRHFWYNIKRKSRPCKMTKSQLRLYTHTHTQCVYSTNICDTSKTYKRVSQKAHGKMELKAKAILGKKKWGRRVLWYTGLSCCLGWMPASCIAVPASWSRTPRQQTTAHLPGPLPPKCKNHLELQVSSFWAFAKWTTGWRSLDHSTFLCFTLIGLEKLYFQKIKIYVVLS